MTSAGGGKGGRGLDQQPTRRSACKQRVGNRNLKVDFCDAKNGGRESGSNNRKGKTLPQSPNGDSSLVRGSLAQCILAISLIFCFKKENKFVNYLTIFLGFLLAIALILWYNYNVV